MRLSLELAAAEHKPYLRSLLSEYLGELSRYGEVDTNYHHFDAYWEEVTSRWPYLIKQESQCIGFTFVNTWSPSGRGTDLAIAEFYIVPNARRRGIGRHAVKAMLQARAGVWELNVMSLNAAAQRFWPGAINAAGAKDVEQINGNGEPIYRFRIG